MLGRLPLGLALSAVTAVWAFGAVWSFTEQSAFARAKGFSDPALLPLVLDGLAVAMAGVAFAASLDARPAVGARLGTALAVAASAASNGLWAAERSALPTGPDWTTVAIGAGIPIAANIAFEVLLGELRRQVQRHRGLPAPAALPSLRLVRLLLDPPAAFTEWRAEVLARTAPAGPPGGGLIGPDPLAGHPALDEAAPRAETALAPAEAPPLEEHQQRAAGPVNRPPATAGTPPLPRAGTGLAVEPADLRAACDLGSVEATHQPQSAEVAQAASDASIEDRGEVAASEQTDVDRQDDTGEGQPTGLPGDGRVRLLRELLEAGAAVSGAQAAVLLSHTYAPTSGRTGRRLLAEARQPLPTTSSDPADAAVTEGEARTGTEDGPRPGTALSLVTRHPPTPPAGELP